MILKYDEIFYVMGKNVTAKRIVTGGVNFELIDILEAHPPDPNWERSAPCFVDRHGTPLFRIGSDPLGIYASAGHLEPQDEFVGAYQYLGLKGLSFDPVWSGEV